MNETRLPFSEAVKISPSVALTKGMVYPFVDMQALEPGLRSVSASEGRVFLGSGSRFRHGDTLLARITPCLENGKIARYSGGPNEAVAHGSTEFIVIRGREGVTTDDFAYYLTLSPGVRSYAISQMTGSSGRQRVPTSSLDHLDVDVPSLEEQRRIAHILGTLDDKIELNRQMNQTLDEIARTLFRSWFVDFDPVRAKAEGRQPEGMDAETAALFPDRLIDSDLGPIPEGWEWRPLDQIANFLNGLALQKYPPRNDGTDLPVIKIAQLRVNNTDGAGLASRDVPDQYQIKDGDFLFSWSGSLLAEIWSGGEGALNQHLFKVTSDFPQWFVYHWVQQHLEHFRGVAADKATTMGHINRHHLSSAMCVVPTDKRLLEAASGMIGSVAALSLNNSLESNTLVKLRDTLLPELLSGHLATNSIDPDGF